MGTAAVKTPSPSCATNSVSDALCGGDTRSIPEDEIISSDETKINSKDDSLTIKELRNRLERRNVLLDIVRKSYHRDVLAIRECILKQQREEHDFMQRLQIPTEENDVPTGKTYNDMGDNKNSAGDDGNTISRSSPLSQSSLSLLSSIPSIDLRHEGLHLFSPQECELRLKPCFQCGGVFEVVHRESSRYQALIRRRDELLQDIDVLKEELADTKKIVHDTKEDLCNFKRITKQRDDEFEMKIDKLEQHVEDYDQLLQLSNDQKNQIDNLENVYKEKESISGILKEVKLDLVKERQDKTVLQKLNGEIEEKNETMILQIKEFIDREKVHEEKIKNMEHTNDELRKKIVDLEDKLSQAKEDLDVCHSEILRLNAKLKRDYDEAAATQNELQATIDHRERSIAELEHMVTSANQNICNLKKDIEGEKKAYSEYSIEMDKKTKRRQIEEEARAKKDLALCNSLTERISFLTTLTSSYIQGLYEQCLAQEELILLEDPSLLNPKTKKIRKNQNASKHTTKLNIIMEGLEKKLDSIHIDWEGILEQDDDRRKIFGNLNNRAQINMSQIDNLIKKIRVKNQSDTERVEEEFKKTIEDNTSKHRDHISRLTKEINKKETALREVEALFKESKDHLKKALVTITELTIEQEKKDTNIDELNHGIKDAFEKQDKLQCELSLVKENLLKANNEIQLKDEEIVDQHETLHQLESILQNTTDRFAAKVEKERMRLETNVDVETQVNVPVSNFSQQADFIIDHERYKAKERVVKTQLFQL